MKQFLYILYLENNNWYVGVSNKPEKRIEKHFKGQGARWTKLHAPKAVAMVKEIKGSRVKAERNATLKLMERYGILNVRGGAWCQRYLKDRQINCIEKQLQKLKNHETEIEKFAKAVGI